MSIKQEDFIRLQEDLLRLKTENNQLQEQLKSMPSNNQSFLSNLFSGSEGQSAIDKLHKEEADLKASASKILEQIDNIKEHFRTVDKSILDSDQISVIEALFQTKKRELIRMKALNDTALSDLEEEAELARGLCDSLESGRASYARDKENTENSTTSLQAAKQTIESRINDLKALNQQYREDLGVKSTVDEDAVDLSEQIEVWQEKLESLELDYNEALIDFEAEEKKLSIIEESKARECEAVGRQQQEQMDAAESQLKTLKRELQSLKGCATAAETVQIDIAALEGENAALRARIAETDRRIAELTGRIVENQTESSFIADWMRREGRARGDANSVLAQILKLAEEKEAEWKSLQ